MYYILKTEKEHIEILIEYKLATIFEYAFNISDEEKNKIIYYVHDEVPKQLYNYKLIRIDKNIIGCLLMVDYEDGVMIDEIYLEKKYRNLGIGSSVINNIVRSQKKYICGYIN